MKKPSAAGLKKVTPENLARLGAERLAEMLIDFADGRAELKRRLRMELAADQGSDHLALEVDKRLTSLEGSKARVSWRARANYLRDLESLRKLIGERFAQLDPAAALARSWRFLDLAGAIGRRVSDKDGEVEAIFDRAARDLGALIASGRNLETPVLLAAAIDKAPVRWGQWLPAIVEHAPADALQGALALLLANPIAPSAMLVVRQLADATGDIDAYRSTFSVAALKAPPVAAEVGARLLAAGRVEEAGVVLEAARAEAQTPGWLGGRQRAPEVDFDWETAWIEYLERSDQKAAAQTARWESFERTLSAPRAKAFVQRLDGFDDVEAESRAFAHAAGHPDASRAVRFLIEWPALPEVARLIQARPDEVKPSQDEAELWAGKLRARQPAAAHTLLRKAAAAAFRRRDFAASDRLTAEADTIDLP